MQIMNNICRLIAAFAFIASMPVSAVIIVDTPPDTPPPGTDPPSNVLIQDAGWYGSCFFIVGGGAEADPNCSMDAGEVGNSMAFDLTGPAVLKVTGVINGDIFDVFINSVHTLTTSTPGINAPQVASDPDAAFASTDFSSESILLGAGSYSVDIFAAAISPIGIGISAIEVQSIPIPAAFWLFGSGLLGLVGLARRKKAT